MFLTWGRLEGQVREIQVRLGYVLHTPQQGEFPVQWIQAKRLVGDAIEQFGEVLADGLRRAVERVECGGLGGDASRLDFRNQAFSLLEEPRHPQQPDDLHGPIGLVQVGLRGLERLALVRVRRESIEAGPRSLEGRVDLAFYPAQRPDVDHTGHWVPGRMGGWLAEFKA